MRINISDIIKTTGASLEINFCGKLPELEELLQDFQFEDSVVFKGSLQNMNGILQLSGSLKATYQSRCYTCLNNIKGKMDISVNENFVDSQKNDDSEAYTYEGYTVEITKSLIDNIILNLPMKQVCSSECKGLCPKCGVDLNNGTCECKEESLNPKLEILKDFFNNQV